MTTVAAGSVLNQWEMLTVLIFFWTLSILFNIFVFGLQKIVQTITVSIHFGANLSRKFHSNYISYVKDDKGYLDIPLVVVAAFQGTPSEVLKFGKSKWTLNPITFRLEDLLSNTRISRWRARERARVRDDLDSNCVKQESHQKLLAVINPVSTKDIELRMNTYF